MPWGSNDFPMDLDQILAWREAIERGERTRIMTDDFSPLSERPILSAVFNYLGRVNSVCPFAPWVARQRGYYLRDWKWSRDELEELAEFVRDEMLADFFGLSPSETKKGQAPDPTTIIYSFSHPDSPRQEFGALVALLAGQWKPLFHERGLMLTEVYPQHADPHGDGRFRAVIPLLVCHRMHKEDIVFMGTPGRIEHYQKFFG